jgi:hypothetical protein
MARQLKVKPGEILSAGLTIAIERHPRELRDVVSAARTTKKRAPNREPSAR